MKHVAKGVPHDEHYVIGFLEKIQVMFLKMILNIQ